MNIKTRDLILVALFTALTAVGAFIRIPIPYVPITLQYLFCAFSGIILGSKLGALSQGLYVALGLFGLPIFAQGGGFSYIFKTSFGFLIGFIAAAYVIGLIVEKMKKVSVFKVFFASVSGLILLYIIGLAYLYMILNVYLNKPASVYTVFKLGFFPSIGGDLLKCLLIALVSVKLIPALRKEALL